MIELVVAALCIIKSVNNRHSKSDV